MYKLSFFLFILLLSTSSCSTVDTLFGTEEAATAAPASNEHIDSQNNQLEAKISALRSSLRHLNSNIAQQKAKKAKKASPADRLWITVSFRSGHMELTPDSSKALKRLASKFLSKERQQTIEVRGYTDNESIGGYSRNRHTPRHPYKTNMALSQARADNVARALINAGLSDKVVTAQGFGATDFTTDNKSDAGRQKNRRAEIHLISH